MCGIAGIFNLKGTGLPAFSPAHVLHTIRHRGPDDEGIFADSRAFLGVRRLAIIDPACGRQPVTDESGRYHLVMNGEIFGYELLMKELKGRGHVFRSHCDTEVALHAVEDQWHQALDRLDGQFAIAAYDAREGRLLLARDRMGICPLFYAQVGDYLVFGSEMKAIFATGLVTAEIDRRSLDAVAAFGCVPAPRSVFRGVRQLPPGRYLEARGGTVTEHTYWDIPFNDAGQYPRKSGAAWAEEFRDVLSRACHSHLRADVPVGLYLSGGIDSSTVAAMTADFEDLSSRVFSIGFPEPGFDESGWTKDVAEFLGLKMHTLLYRQKDLARDIADHVYHGETPLVSTEGVPLMALAQLASRHVKVVLTGEGSDEALGGYEYFRWDAFRQWAGEGLLGRLFQAMMRPGIRRTLGHRNALLPDAEGLAYADSLFGCNPAIMQKFIYFRLVRDLVYTDEALERSEGQPDAEFIDLPREKLQRWDTPEPDPLHLQPHPHDQPPAGVARRPGGHGPLGGGAAPVPRPVGPGVPGHRAADRQDPLDEFQASPAAGDEGPPAAPGHRAQEEDVPGALRHAVRRGGCDRRDPRPPVARAHRRVRLLRPGQGPAPDDRPGGDQGPPGAGPLEQFPPGHARRRPHRPGHGHELRRDHADPGVAGPQRPVQRRRPCRRGRQVRRRAIRRALTDVREWGDRAV